MEPRDDGGRGVRAYVAATIAAWVVFHGGPLLGLELLPLGELFPVREYASLSGAALAAVLVGMALGARRAPARAGADNVLSAALEPTATYLELSALPVAAAAAYAALAIARGGYRDVTTIPRPLNLLLYVSLTLLPVVLWNRDRLSRREYVVLLAAVVVPRLFISLTGPRFVVLQAAIPIVFWEAMHARKVSLPRLVVGAVAAYAFLFHLVPALRKDAVSGFQHIVYGSPVTLLPQFKALRLLDDAPASLVPCEIVAGATRLDVCDLRQFFGIPEDVEPRLDRAATHFTRERTGIDAIGTGGNPILEAFPELELGWNLGWFLVIGGVCGFVLRGMRQATICCFLLPHVAAKGLFFWRGTITEFFDRIPLILVVYAGLAALVALQRRRQRCAS
jgi:hypothetical protein